jgi:tetrahydromethanopterin S-methyltransferase subunit B
MCLCFQDVRRGDDDDDEEEVPDMEQVTDDVTASVESHVSPNSTFFGRNQIFRTLIFWTVFYGKNKLHK